MAKPGKTFQEMISALDAYWREAGCLQWLPYHEPVGAGTFNSATVLRVLGPEPWSVAYVEPSFRPDDGRFAENPNRVQMHHQYQVILKPGPKDPLGVYLGSLAALGIERDEHDVRFVEDNWESPALGAWGLGWEVWLDGMEVTQFTYFQQAGGVASDPPAVEITYGLERLAMYLQNVDSLWDISWDGVRSYGDLLREQEIEFCKYDFNDASIDNVRKMYDLYRAEAQLCIDKGLVIPAHDHVLRCSNAFNILDARGAIGLAERVKFFGETRALARAVSALFMKQREALGHPLMKYMPPAEALPTPVEVSVPKRTTETMLFEIGTEELASAVPESLALQIEEKLPALLVGARISFESVQVFATPRRLVAIARGMVTMQPDSTQVVRGPRRDVCERNPKALEGFCRKNGIASESVGYEVVDGVEYATATVHHKGEPTARVLSRLLPELLAALRAESSMRWLASAQVGEVAATTFNRPIRSLVALLGDQVVSFNYANVASGAVSFGGRWSGSQPLSIGYADKYLEVMKAANVVVDHRARKDEVVRSINAAAASVRGNSAIDPKLLAEVTQIVEFPSAFVGNFPQEFLELPETVLVGIMSKHLRCFPVYGADGKLLPYFIAVRNGPPTKIEKVRAGYERVIVARFSDAKFFVSRDSEKKLEDFRERIATLVFVAKIGSMLDKSDRLGTLTERLIEGPLPVTVTRGDLKRAAFLAKADLGSQMVIEMSSLQGEMGEVYALRSGESPAVAQALREQYLPRFPGDKIPASDIGFVLAVADRIDNLAAFFSLGIEPTGSADPYGLRRDGLGLVSLLLEKKQCCDLRAAFSEALRLLPTKADLARAHAIVDFLSKRLEVVLRDAGYRYDVVRAALARAAHDPFRALQLCAEAEEALNSGRYEAAITAHLRCARILDHAAEKKFSIPENFSAALLSEPAEQKLSAALDSVAAAWRESNLAARLNAVDTITPVINSFFDTVIVIAPDAALRDNRLALVARVASLLDPLLDLRLLESTARSPEARAR